MKPVNVNAFDLIGDMAAAGAIAFGAAVAYKAAGTVQATIDIAVSENLLGIVDEDMVEKDEAGFYSQYDAVPIITAGRCRVWVTSNEAAKEDILAGDYLEVADLGGTNTLTCGILQQMGAESGTCTGAVREATSIARALEDVTLTDVEPATLSGKTLTLLAADILLLGLAVGDYVVLEDASHEAEMNRVAALPSTTTVTLQFTPSAITAVDTLHKVHQVEAMLI